MGSSPGVRVLFELGLSSVPVTPAVCFCLVCFVAATDASESMSVTPLPEELAVLVLVRLRLESGAEDV